MKQLKAVIVSLVLALLIASVSLYASGEKKVKKEAQKNPPVVVKQEAKKVHSDCSGNCSGSCSEKHAKGECKGHKPGQPHDEKEGHEKPKQ